MKWLGWALLIAGSAGAYYRYTLYQASSQGNPGLVNNSLKTFDPASMVGIAPGTGLLDMAMGVDVLAIALGAVLVSGKRLL
jgi:hypothetical protein